MHDHPIEQLVTCASSIWHVMIFTYTSACHSSLRSLSFSGRVLSSCSSASGSSQLLQGASIVEKLCKRRKHTDLSDRAVYRGRWRGNGVSASAPCRSWYQRFPWFAVRATTLNHAQSNDAAISHIGPYSSPQPGRTGTPWGLSVFLKHDHGLHAL